jgi:hypothetical protein
MTREESSEVIWRLSRERGMVAESVYSRTIFTGKCTPERHLVDILGLLCGPMSNSLAKPRRIGSILRAITVTVFPVACLPHVRPRSNHEDATLPGRVGGRQLT